MTRLIHITPELPPTVGGIADYTAILTQRLVEVADGAVEPVLVRAGKAPGTLPEVDFRCVDHGGTYSAKTLCATIEQLANEANGPSGVLLQYSGYGYAPRGAPLWLLRALQRACGENGVPLITMFHELYATGAPWTSAFWLSPVQRYVAAQLARLSSAVVTNRAKSATWLSRYVPAETPVRVQPVFSNVGEPEHLPGWDEREPYAVVFGGRSKKKRLYESLKANQVREIQEAGVDHIVDIGSPSVVPDELHGLSVYERGILPAVEVSRQLKQARMGLLSYPVDYLTKSGIWAAYAAHGVYPLLDSPKRMSRMLHSDHHFSYLSRKGAADIAKENDIGRDLFQWYNANASSCRCAILFLELLDNLK